MKVRSDLATGHSRTANARNRMRNGWSEIATALNSVGNGCIKDWKQWAKYWKDKKAATKRKANVAVTAMQRTGGGVDIEIVELSNLEQEILTISGGLSVATGDRNLAINPFPEQGNAVQPPPSSESSSHSESILQQLHDETADTVAENLETSTIATPSEQYEGVHIQNVVEMVSPSDRDRNEGGEMPTIRPSDGVRGAQRRICFDSPRRHRGSPVPSPAQRPVASSRPRRAALTPPRGGVPAGRRRPLHRSPPSQRRSEMARVIERFIVIEEQRAEAELASARSREALARAREAEAQGSIIMATAIDRFGDTMRDIIRQSIETVLQFRATNSN